MFYWMRRSGGSDMSKAEILRGIVTEKLSTAAQEILAVVERTVAGYEEEAAGFRREIDRQRRQLELLLQPRVKLERRALIPDLESHEVVVVSEEEEEEEEEQQHTQQSGVEDTGSLGLLWYDDDDDDDEEQQLSARPATSSRQRREDLKDPDYQITSRLISPRGRSDRRGPGRPRISDTQSHLDLRVRILEDLQTDVLSKRVFQKYPVQEVRCPRGLQEEDFLDLLRSTFPQLGPQKPFDFFTTDRTKRLQPLRVETLTPEEICRTPGHSALYVRLKTQEKVQVGEEEFHLAGAVKDSSSTSDGTRLNTSCSSARSSSSTSQHENTEIEEADDEDGGPSLGHWSLLVLSESEGDGGEVSGDDWKPDKSLKHPRESEPEKTTRKRHFEHAGVQTKLRKRMQSSPKASTDSSDALSCKVCRAVRWSKNMLIKHAWSHMDDPERLCGVCGEHSESAEELRSHLQSYQKTHSCNICGKSFLSISGFNGHVARHKGQKPYKCEICHKAFPQMSVLMNHKWVHVADKPHKCCFCQKSCGSKVELTRHMVTHTDEKLHRCNICSKSLRCLETLSQHMMSHTGHRVRETTFECEICSQTFNTSKKLQVHMRSHSRERTHLCTKCNKRFFGKSNLETHMRVHTGEKPHKCSVCDLSFPQQHCVKRHMKTHQDESDSCKTDAPVQIH